MSTIKVLSEVISKLCRSLKSCNVWLQFAYSIPVGTPRILFKSL